MKKIDIIMIMTLNMTLRNHVGMCLHEYRVIVLTI